MTAKEMFEDLGYQDYSLSVAIGIKLYLKSFLYADGTPGVAGLMFDSSEQLISFINNKYYCGLDLELLNVISKQVEELGW